MLSAGGLRCGAAVLVVKTLESEGSRLNPDAATQLNDCGQLT